MLCTPQRPSKIISVVGAEIKKKISKEIQTAKYFSLLADEVTDCGNLEQLSVVIRFVEGDKQIREEFRGFIIVERITGEALSTALLSWLGEHEIDIIHCVEDKAMMVLQACLPVLVLVFSKNSPSLPACLVNSLSKSPIKSLHC